MPETPAIDRAAAEAEAEELLIRSLPVRRTLWFLGAVSLALGLVGVALPVLPTTPFLLLTAALWARSSKRFYVWLLQHPWMGPPIVAWRRDRYIAPRAKVAAITLLALSAGSSAWFFVPLWWCKVGVVAVAAAVAIWILRVPNAPRGNAPVDGVTPS